MSENYCVIGQKFEVGVVKCGKARRGFALEFLMKDEMFGPELTL